LFWFILIHSLANRITAPAAALFLNYVGANEQLRKIEFDRGFIIII
jgi:hypothetical protein